MIGDQIDNCFWELVCRKIPCKYLLVLASIFLYNVINLQNKILYIGSNFVPDNHPLCE